MSPNKRRRRCEGKESGQERAVKRERSSERPTEANGVINREMDHEVDMMPAQKHHNSDCEGLTPLTSWGAEVQPNMVVYRHAVLSAHTVHVVMLP